MKYSLKALFIVLTLACLIAAFPGVAGTLLSMVLLATVIFAPIVALGLGLIFLYDYVVRGLAATTEDEDSKSTGPKDAWMARTIIYVRLTGVVALGLASYADRHGYWALAVEPLGGCGLATCVLCPMCGSLGHLAAAFR